MRSTSALSSYWWLVLCVFFVLFSFVLLVFFFRCLFVRCVFFYSFFQNRSVILAYQNSQHCHMHSIRFEIVNKNETCLTVLFWMRIYIYIKHIQMQFIIPDMDKWECEKICRFGVANHLSDINHNDCARSFTDAPNIRFIKMNKWLSGVWVCV